MLNREGVALLRALIFKMWSLREARENGDCAAIASEINLWLPDAMQVSAADVYAALDGITDRVKLNSAVLRDTIDRMPHLFSARLSGDYQAILNEVQHAPQCAHVTFADVVEAMASKPVPRPAHATIGVAALVGASGLGESP